MCMSLYTVLEIKITDTNELQVTIDYSTYFGQLETV